LAPAAPISLRGERADWRERLVCSRCGGHDIDGGIMASDISIAVGDGARRMIYAELAQAERYR
jgi:hypothetical protein